MNANFCHIYFRRLSLRNFLINNLIRVNPSSCHSTQKYFSVALTPSFNNKFSIQNKGKFYEWVSSLLLLIWTCQKQADTTLLTRNIQCLQQKCSKLRWKVYNVICLRYWERGLHIELLYNILLTSAVPILNIHNNVIKTKNLIAKHCCSFFNS